MFNIAVTGVGGGVGQSILKSLADTDYNVVGLDGELLGVGLYATKTSYLIPYASDPNYIPKLLEICKNERITLLFPGLDAELMPLSIHRDAFQAIGTTVVVSKPEVISISDDKQITYDKLTAAGVSVPFTAPLVGFDASMATFPLIIKQKVGGARSKNIYLVKTSSAWEATINSLQSELSDYIVMDYIVGDEYTCGTVSLDNSCKGVIVMRRVLRDGDTHKCFVEINVAVESEVRKAVAAMEPFGACNVQLRVRDGKPYIFEINARCSGTTAARTLSGFNEPKMISDYLLKGIQPKYEIKQQTILRYWKELLVDNDLVVEMKQNGKIVSHNRPNL